MTNEQTFEDYLKNQDFSKITVRGYLFDITHFSEWFLKTNGEKMTPAQITPIDIKTYRQFLLVEERYKANTINRRLAAISTYIKWARSTGQIFSDPSENIKGVSKVKESPKWMNKNEQYALQRAIEKDLQISKLRFPKRWIARRRDASLVIFLLNTGLRLTELIAMRMDDLQLSERKGSVLVQNGKGGKQRNIPLNAEARKALQDWLAVRPKTKSPYVWTAIETNATGLSGRAIQRIMKRYSEEAGIDEITPHICRHTFAKNLINQGVGLEKIAMLLGHSSLNTTRLYITPDEHDLESAVGKLE